MALVSMKCPSCGGEVDLGKRTEGYCTYCGTKVVYEAPKPNVTINQYNGPIHLDDIDGLIETDKDLVKQGHNYIAQNELRKAADKFQKAIEKNEYCAEAWVYAFCTKHGFKRPEQLDGSDLRIDNSSWYASNEWFEVRRHCRGDEKYTDDVLDNYEPSSLHLSNKESYRRELDRQTTEVLKYANYIKASELKKKIHIIRVIASSIFTAGVFAWIASSSPYNKSARFILPIAVLVVGVFFYAVWVPDDRKSITSEKMSFNEKKEKLENYNKKHSKDKDYIKVKEEFIEKLNKIDEISYFE